MKKSRANLLTFWIPYRPLRRSARYHLIEFHPIKEFLKKSRINSYLEQKSKRGKAKVVIYSAMAGNYDDLRTHYYLTDDFDYVFYTDKVVKAKSHAWEIRIMEDLKESIPVRRARYHKMFPHKLFPDYEYSVWIDAKYEIVGAGFEKIIKEQIANGILMSSIPHPDRNCLYKEADLCIKLKKDKSETIQQQVDFLKEEGYPENNGLCDTAIIFRKHHNSLVKNVMNDWWNILNRFSFRDQLSFGYALWKNNFKIDYLFSLKNSPAANKNKDIIFHFHKK